MNSAISHGINQTKNPKCTWQLRYNLLKLLNPIFYRLYIASTGILLCASATLIRSLCLLNHRLMQLDQDKRAKHRE